MKKTDFWISPTLCGCVLERTHEWRVSEKVRLQCIDRFSGNPRLADQFIANLESQGLFDEVVTSYTISQKCAVHDHFSDGASLAAELLNFGQCAHRLDTCGCSIAYTFDKRAPDDQRVHVPLDHPIHTRRCVHHDHLTDYVEHHDAVVAENRRLAIEKRNMAEVLGIPQAELQFSISDQREIVIDETAHGLSQEAVKKLIADKANV